MIIDFRKTFSFNMMALADRLKLTGRRMHKEVMRAGNDDPPKSKTALSQAELIDLGVMLIALASNYECICNLEARKKQEDTND